MIGRTPGHYRIVRFLIAICLLIAPAPVFGREDSVAELVGLWGSERVFAPEIRGELSIVQQESRWRVRIRPGNSTAHNNLGAAPQKMGKLEEAIRHFRQVLRIRPAYANAHHNLANALLSQGKLEEAIRHFRQALRIKPNDADTHADLGSAFAGQGNLVQAVAHYESALRINPEHPIAWKNLKWARAQLEKTE